MAVLRFHRDRRGYEHFYLVEPTTTRRGKSRARVLYWFRSPPNVKVGREPFDEGVRRALEAQNPGVVFDWQKISETPVPSADAERWRERRRQERAARAAQRGPGAEPDVGEVEDEGIELPDSAAPDVALDAAEQQADALAPTEESLVSIAATVDPPASSNAVQTGEPVNERRDRHRHRRRRRRRPHATHNSTAAASAEPGCAVAVDPRQPLDPGEPPEHESPERREPHDV